MKKIEELQFLNSTIRILVKEIKNDTYIQKGVLDLVAKCAVVSTSFIACISEDIRKEENEKGITYEHIAKVFEGLGLFELSEEMRKRHKQLYHQPEN